MAAARAAGPQPLHWTLGSSAWPRARATLSGAASVTRGPAAGGCPWQVSSRARAGGGQQRRPLLPMAPAGARACLTRGRAGRAQASSSSSFSWLGASSAGPADRAPGLRGEAAAAAARGSRQWQRKRLRALGWSRGARARARTRRVLSPTCARAAAGRGPPTPSHTPRGGCPRREGGGGRTPTCGAETRLSSPPGSHPPGHPHGRHAPADPVHTLGWSPGHTGRVHWMHSQEAEVENPDAYTAQLGEHTYVQVPVTS